MDGVSANALKVARFDQNGAKRGATIDVPATATIDAISIAGSGDALLVAFQGAPSSSSLPEVHGVVIDTSGNVAQNVLLSHASDEGSNITAGVDGDQWMIAWRNNPPQTLVVISTPQSDLHVQTRRDIPIAVVGFPMLVVADSGNVYWLDRAASSFVHKTVVSTGIDSVLGQSASSIDSVRLANGIPVWSVRAGVTGSTTSLFQTPLGLFGCFTALDSSVDYDTRDGGLALYVYSDGTQLHTQVPSPTVKSTRHRGVKH